MNEGFKKFYRSDVKEVNIMFSYLSLAKTSYMFHPDAEGLGKAV